MPTKTTESTKFKDTMRPEYDMTRGVRGKYASRFKRRCRDGANCS